MVKKIGLVIIILIIGKVLIILGLGLPHIRLMVFSRQWNISNNSLYIKNVNDTNESYFEKELLSEVDQFNEYILTSLRTIWGIDAEVFEK